MIYNSRQYGAKGTSMTLELDYGDLPIAAPEEDLFGIDPFVSSLAQSIRTMKTPKGVVLALNGPWGSGKSSAINLLQHHLAPAIAAGEIDILAFNPWWFRGEEALVLAFFRELYAATKPSLPDKAQKALPKLGAKLLKAGGVVAAGADMFGAAGAGTLASGAMTWLSGLIEGDGESVEKLHRELADALAEQQRRFVILIDDIDRLAPDEALAMFRLVKSVGRLPNVIYVLAFDRLLAEKVVSERFPSEGPHYLEKIVQASFELPAPEPSDLTNHLLANIVAISGEPSEVLIVHVMNLFHEIVAPEMRTPRDAVRFLNAFSVTWPAVAGDVDQGDFIALEAYRVFQPGIYAAIRANPNLLCGALPLGGSHKEATPEQLDALLLGSVTDKARYRRGLMRLFPKLEGLWGNVHYSDVRGWQRQRRLCTKDHFPTYFRLAVADSAVPSAELNRFLVEASDRDSVRSAFREAVKVNRRAGGTRAALLLDALTQSGAEIDLRIAGSLLGALFELVDELDVEQDRAKGFAFGDNRFRIHWLMRSLLLERTSLEERTKILLGACQYATLSWLCWLADSAWEDFHPRNDKSPEPEENCLMTLEGATQLRNLAHAEIERAASDGSLVDNPKLIGLLYHWLNFTDDGGAAVRAWTLPLLGDDIMVARLAKLLTSHSWSQGMGFGLTGDLVARRSDRANVDGLEEIIDKDRLRQRIEALDGASSLPEALAEDLHRFRVAWDHHRSYGD